MVSAGIDQIIPNVMYISSIKSDHRALFVAIEMKDSDRGKGYWKFNTKLLTNQDLISKINTVIQEGLVKYERKSPKEKWEEIKTAISKAAKKFSKDKISEDKLIISQLSEIVNSLESRLPLMEKEL